MNKFNPNSPWRLIDITHCVIVAVVDGLITWDVQSPGEPVYVMVSGDIKNKVHPEGVETVVRFITDCDYYAFVTTAGLFRWRIAKNNEYEDITLSALDIPLIKENVALWHIEDCP